MRLPFPERVPMIPVFFFAGTLCVIQLAQGTNPTFALFCLVYISIAALAFNLAGGFSRTSGAFVFFNSVLSLIIGLCMKAYLGEPADSNLFSPLLTISVYVVGMLMMLVAVFFTKRLATKRAIMGRMVTDANMQTATVGCLIAGILIYVFAAIIPSGAGSVLSALNQINRFFPMAIILGTINTIRRSGGTRSINLPVLIAGFLSFTIGALGFSKEGMFAPFACWLLAAASQRYRMVRWQLVAIVFGTIFIFRYLVPYAQYGRIYRDENGGIDISTSISLLTDLGYVREQYLASSTESYEERVLGYFNKPQGLFDRLQLISIDDALIAHTEQFGTFGMYPIIASLENTIPHFIWKDKPVYLTGNVFAHEVGLLGPEDESTGVSFSSTSTAFHVAGWYGIFFLAPALWFALFWIFDSLCGDTRQSPWGLLVLVLFAHAAPEADVSSIIYMCVYTAFGIFFAAIMGSYVMPILGTLFVGPEGIMIRRGPAIRSIPSRLLPPVSSEI